MRFDRRLLTILVALALVAGALGGGLLLAGKPAAAATQASAGDGESEQEGPDRPITGEALDRASAAALEYIGQGRVTGTEVGDEEGYYEIEVTLDGGGQVDVHLDQGFNVLGREADGDGQDD